MKHDWQEYQTKGWAHTLSILISLELWGWPQGLIKAVSDSVADSMPRSGHNSLPFCYLLSGELTSRGQVAKYNMGIACSSAVISYRESCQMDEGLL